MYRGRRWVIFFLIIDVLHVLEILVHSARRTQGTIYLGGFAATLMKIVSPPWKIHAKAVQLWDLTVKHANMIPPKVRSSANPALPINSWMIKEVVEPVPKLFPVVSAASTLHFSNVSIVELAFKELPNPQPAVILVKAYMLMLIMDAHFALTQKKDACHAYLMGMV